uniref:Uncharacterized protein n=1 Tax=Kalanchoe fedtschenkoi TaxID=63787 RepID=A0A7N0USL3_KALFE
MALAFTTLSWLSWSRKCRQTKAANCSSSNTTQDPGLLELDMVKFPIANGNNIASSSRRVKRKWGSREERKLNKECDVVLVPHDGACVSASESDDSDWSVGWLEPHGPEFQSDDDESQNNSFAVLVPCYGRGAHNAATENHQNNFFGPTGNFSDGLPAESKKYMEQWLSSLQTT